MVMDLATEMPRVKNNEFSQIHEISVEDYLAGKKSEAENFYSLKEGLTITA